MSPEQRLQNLLIPTGLVIITGLVIWSFLRIALDQTRMRVLAIVSLTIMVLPVLPVLDLRSLTAGDIVHDRYLYLPSVGFVLLAAVLIREFARRFTRHQFAIEASLVGAAAVLFAVATVGQQMQWSDDVSLYSRGVESAPENLTVRDNLANAFLERAHPERSIPLYLEVLDKNPTFWRSNYNLGFAYYKTGNYSAAEDYLQKANRLNPKRCRPIHLSRSRTGPTKQTVGSGQNGQRAIARDPHGRGYHQILAMIYEAGGDLDAALSQLREEINEHPDNQFAMSELQRLVGKGTSSR